MAHTDTAINLKRSRVIKMSKFPLTDFHTHILPGMDDGSDSLETSLAMLEQLEKQGISDVVLTPHYYSNREPLDRFLQRRAACFAKLTEAYHGSIQLHLGAEVYYSNYLFNNDDLSALCLADSDIMLLELPYNITLGDHHVDQIWRLASEYNLTLLLAHIDRYASIIKSAKMMDKLLQVGCLFQINLSSLERFGKRKVISLVNRGLVDAIGTDCHNLDSRPPAYQKGFEVLRNAVPEHQLQALLESMQQMLTSN